MTKLMLIDTSHPEETRVVVAENDKVQDYDVVTSTKKQIKSNIYLAKVTRVEPSLQAVFVDYGADRQGFLPFAEVHPDYYQIPVADKEALKAEAASINKRSRRDEDDAHSAESDDESNEKPRGRGRRSRRPIGAKIDNADKEEQSAASEDRDDTKGQHTDDAPAEDTTQDDTTGEANGNGNSHVEVISGEEEDLQSSPKSYQFLKRYKVQEVVKKGQVLLIQVTKEERGTKGAAVTTYISIAGRYCVLMPNTTNAGGISRKINSGDARRNLKKISDSLQVTDGMSVIIRTAGIDRSRAEIKRDLDYLKRLWDDIREQTLKSSAPAIIHEESDLIKRAIRDLYKNDIDEVLVEGEDGYKNAKSFMKMLMPSHAARVKHYKGDIPLLYAYDIEEQLLSMHDTDVPLRSGGYLVINPTEALVSIDINSGRATRERNIEETALKTNMEAAHEIARQLRLRDLSGLLVIDFIDMYEFRNRRKVERALKDALRSDRARIQVGRISAFGLMEMSRQRLRPSVTESNTLTCPHCTGRGIVRSTESFSLQLLRAIEKESYDNYFDLLEITTQPEVALYVLNHKRIALSQLEQKYNTEISLSGDRSLQAQGFTITKVNTHSKDSITINEREEILSGTKQAKQARRTTEKQFASDDFHYDVTNAHEKELSEDSAEEQEDNYNREDRDDRDDREEGDGRRGRRRGRRGGRRGRRGGRDRQNDTPENSNQFADYNYENNPSDTGESNPYDFDMMADFDPHSEADGLPDNAGPDNASKDKPAAEDAKAPRSRGRRPAKADTDPKDAADDKPNRRRWGRGRKADEGDAAENTATTDADTDDSPKAKTTARSTAKSTTKPAAKSRSSKKSPDKADDVATITEDKTAEDKPKRAPRRKAPAKPAAKAKEDTKADSDKADKKKPAAKPAATDKREESDKPSSRATTARSTTRSRATRSTKIVNSPASGQTTQNDTSSEVDTMAEPKKASANEASGPRRAGWWKRMTE